MMVVNGVGANTVAVLDRGLMYGDGVFRTLALRDGKLLHWPQQLRKLAEDCSALQLDCPPETDWLAALRQALGTQRDATLKLMVTRGCGTRGYRYPEYQRCNWMVLPSPPADYPPECGGSGVAVRLCELRLGWQPRLAGIKHLNRLENVLARNEWDDPAIREGILLDHAGNVIEGTMSNLLLIRDGRLLTPALDQCGVAGVMRELVLQAAFDLGMEVEVGRVSLQQLLQAEEVGLCNSLIGLWPVRALGERRWTAFTLLRQLQLALDESMCHLELFGV